MSAYCTHLWQYKQCPSPRQDNTGSRSTHLNTQREDKLHRQALQICIGLHGN